MDILSIFKRNDTTYSVQNEKLNKIERSIADLNNLYINTINGFKRNPYLKTLPDSGSQRVDTFEFDDNLIEGMEFDQRVLMYKKMYSSSGWVQRGGDAIAADCTNTYPLTDVLYDEEKFANDVIYRSKLADINRLMDNPSYEMDKRTLHVLTYLELIMFGNSFWQKIWNKTRTQILTFVKLRPESIKIVPRIDKRTNIIHYFYLQKVGTDINNNNQYRVLNQDDVIHFAVPNIINPLYGRSKLDGLTYIVFMDVQAQKYQSKFFKYGVSPGCIINIEDLSEDTADYFNNMLKQRYSNMREPHSALILPGKVKILNDKDNLADLDLRGLREADAAEILNILGIPPLLLSIDKLQIQRQDTSLDNYMEHTVAPLQRLFVDTLNEQLIKRHYDETSIIITTGSQVVPGTKDAAEFVKTIMQLVPMTTNEVRERVGLTLLETGGDEFFIYTPNGVVPLNYHFNYQFDEEDERTVELDGKGKPIDPKKMFSHIDFKLSKRIKREIEMKLGKDNKIASKQYKERMKQLSELQSAITREVDNNYDSYTKSVFNLKSLVSKINVDGPKKFTV